MANKILITGSSGYIGSHLVKYFSKQGSLVFGIDLVFPPKTLQKYFSAHIVEDISNQIHVEEFLEKNKPDLVVHCAAKCLVEESMKEPDLYFEYNVTKAAAFLQSCLQSGVQHFLFSSSCATYGEPTKEQMDENHPQNPTNPYGKTKLEFERILLSDKKITPGIVRYFNVAGADPELEIGEHHEPETHLIPNIIRAIQNDRPVSVFGNDYPTRDGSCVRDYVHVWDLCHFHWQLAQRMLEEKKGDIYNLGSASGFSILEVIQAAEKIVGKKVERKFLPRRPGDPSTLVADATKARKDFNWNPQYSTLPIMIQTALDWHRKMNP